MTPGELVQIRVTLSTVLLAGAYGLFARRLLTIRVKDVGYFLLLGGVTMAGVQFTYFYAISKIQVAAAILLEYLAPVLVAFYSILLWKERLSVSKLVSLGLAVSGCYLVVGGYDLEILQMNRLGILSGLAAAVCFAGYTLLGERGMHRYSPWTILFYSLAFSALTWHILHTPFHYLWAGYTWQQWLRIVYIVIMGTVLPFGLYFLGVNYIRSTRASITATAEPISAGFLAFIFLGETLELLQIIGGLLAIGAIALLQIERERDELTPALIRNRNNQG
jgi:drug/metabolite transporter (DMT)-like permease